MANHDTRPTEVLVPAATAPPDRGRRRAARAWITIAAIVAIVASLLIVADVVTRGIAEQRIADQIQVGLPAGVEGDVDVSVGGFSVIAQLLAGTMDRVELSAPELLVEGAPLRVDVVGEGVPVDLASPVERIDATVVVGQDALNQLVTVPGVDGGFVLGDGTVGYGGSIDLLGLSFEYAVAAKPTAAGDSVLLEPAEVKVDAGGAAVDVSALVTELVGEDALDVCIAPYLPDGVEVSSITVAPGTARIELDAQWIMLDRASLEQTGRCD